jgi:hypothetical protein
MDFEQAKTIEAVAGTIGKIWPMVWALIGGVISAISGLVGAAVWIFQLNRRTKINETKTTELQQQIDAEAERGRRRLYYEDGQLVYVPTDLCRQHRETCQQAICKKVDEIKKLQLAREKRDEARHQAIQEAILDLAKGERP